MTLPLVPGVTPTGRRIAIDFLTTPVGGELAMQISYEGIPEGWGFVHTALLDALKQVAARWVQEQVQARARIVQGNGERL